MQSDKYLINNLLENMRLRGDHPSCNVQIHPALNSSGSYEAYQCTISVNHNNLYADDANPTNANPGNFEVQGMLNVCLILTDYFHKRATLSFI